MIYHTVDKRMKIYQRVFINIVAFPQLWLSIYIGIARDVQRDALTAH